MQGIYKLDRFPHVSMLLLLFKSRSETSALGGVVQLKRVCLAAYPISWYSEKRYGLNRIGHPDWVKLCVELNCAPYQNPKFSFNYIYIYMFYMQWNINVFHGHNFQGLPWFFHKQLFNYSISLLQRKYIWKYSPNFLLDNGLVSFVYWYINLRKLFNAKSILVVEQWWYYLANNWFIPFPSVLVLRKLFNAKSILVEEQWWYYLANNWFIPFPSVLVLRKLFNAKSILVEEQWWYYLANNWFIPFPSVLVLKWT